MPKKSKKSRSTDPNLPDLETRRANLLAIGMPSPYQGETTSSSSLDDSSSSTTANEIEESRNAGRLERAAEDSSVIACHSADDEKHSTRESESPDITITSYDTEPQTDSKKSVGNICESTSSVLVKAPQSGYISEARNTSTTTASVSSGQSYQNSHKDLGNECSKDSSIISLQPPEKNASKHMSCAIQAPKDPKLSKSIECVEDDQRLSQTTVCRILVKGEKHEIKGKDNLIKHPDDGVDAQKEANREEEKNKTHNEDSKQEPSEKHTAEKPGLSEVVTLERKTRTVESTNRMPGKSPKEKIFKITATTICITDVSSKERAKRETSTKHSTEVSSKESSKSATPTKHSTEVSSKERLKSATPTKHSTEFSSKERSKSATPTKHSKEISSKRSKSVTPTKHSKEISSKERLKSITPTKTKVRSKSLTPTKRSKEISSKEKTKRLTPTKYTTEVLSKEISSIAPANISPEASREKYERTLSPIKYPLKVPLEVNKKTAISTKPTPEASSREKREKTVISTTDTMVITPKEKTKTVTPTKCTPEISSKEITRTLKPSKHKSDASLLEKCEKTLTCTPEAPLNEKTKTVTPVKHNSKDASKERSKTPTPTKRMPEASSNENRARSVTPSKRTPEVLSKGETKSEIELKKASVALSREKFEKVMTQTKYIPEASTGSGELKPNKAAKNTMADTQEKVKKPVAPTRFTEETSCRERMSKPETPKKCTKQCTNESAVTHYRERAGQESEREYKARVKFTIPEIRVLSEDSNESKDSDLTEQNVISFKEFKEALGVDRVPSPNISLDVFDKAAGIYEDSENVSPNRSTEPQQQTPVISTEEFLEALAMALNNMKLKLISLDESKTEAKIEPTSATEPRMPHLTIEEFRSALGTDRITPARTDDDLDVFNKALEKSDAKKRRRVTFLIPNEPVPSTSRAKTSPERQLGNKACQNTEPDFSRNQTLSGGALTFEEFHRGLRTFGYLKPELLNLDVFDKALEEMERNNSLQPSEEVHKDSCRPNPLAESDESNSSDEDINKAIAASGIKMKRFRVASSDDEPKNSVKSDPSKMSNQPRTKIGESKLCAPGITSRILEEDSYLSESTSKSSEASLEDSSGKSSEPDLVSSESVVKSSESETSPMEYTEKSPEEEVESSESAVKSTESEPSPMEYIEKSPEEEVESSESAVKSTESEPSPEEYIEVFKESTELHESEKTPGFEESPCEIKTGRGESSEDAELKSPKKRRRSERIIALKEKSMDKQPRSRTQSESDLRKRRPGNKDSKPKKKRYSEEH